MKTWDTVKVPDGPNNIFVFGSNTQGRHGKGAALMAKRQFGAKYGQAEGFMGRSYGIITKDISHGNKLRSISLSKIRKGIIRFYEFAAAHPDYSFYVTRLGCGLAGYTEHEIRCQWLSCRESHTDNVILPSAFT